METTRTVEEIEIKSEESNESLRIQKKGRGVDVSQSSNLEG